jgi:hypothetical protein
MSNTLLGMHSRYRIPFKEVLAHNRVYSFKLMLPCIAGLNIYSAYAL